MPNKKSLKELLCALCIIVVIIVMVVAVTLCMYLAYVKHDLQLIHTKLEERVRNLPILFSQIDIPIFVINLTRDVIRWQFQENQRNDLQIPHASFTRVDAIDGEKLLLNPADASSDNLAVDVYRYDRSFDVVVDRAFGKHKANIVACTLSHIIAVKTAYQSGADLAVIAEDDASWLLAPWWQESLSSLAKRMPLPPDSPFTIELYSHAYFPRKGLRKDQHNWGGTAYVVNRSGMKRLLETVFHGSTGGSGSSSTGHTDHTMYLQRTPEISQLPADLYIYSVIGSRWSTEPTFVYPYNCPHPSTLHRIYDLSHIWHARRSLKRAMRAAQIGVE